MSVSRRNRKGYVPQARERTKVHLEGHRSGHCCAASGGLVREQAAGREGHGELRRGRPLIKFPLTATWSPCDSSLKTISHQKENKSLPSLPTAVRGRDVSITVWGRGLLCLRTPEPPAAIPELGAASHRGPRRPGPPSLGPRDPPNAGPPHEASAGLTTDRWSVC